MPDLEKLIAEWKQRMGAMPGIGEERLAELESHVRETVEGLMHSGLPESDAFERAVSQLGSPSSIAEEFARLHQTLWSPIKVIYGLGVLAVVALATGLFPHVSEGRSNLLLATHVFTLTLGYIAVLLQGVLGICFVCQRVFLWRPDPAWRAVGRINVVLAAVSASLILIGIILGMVWARISWGRAWEWEPKEAGALCVLIWALCYWFAQIRGSSARRALVTSILGNVIVSLAWLGPGVLAALPLHSYTSSNYSVLLLVTVLVNLAFFVIGCTTARAREFAIKT